MSSLAFGTAQHSTFSTYWHAANVSVGNIADVQLLAVFDAIQTKRWATFALMPTDCHNGDGDTHAMALACLVSHCWRLYESCVFSAKAGHEQRN